ncbi:MAG TPA: alpha/beta hydrolase [Anaerolineae bacterium]|nr:alpha/beta hydrolase [Anaerolineae bacterium]
MNAFAAIAFLLGLASFATSIMRITRLKGALSVFLLIPKLLAAALAPWTALLGLVAAGLGLFSRSRIWMGLNLLLGGVAAFLSMRYIQGAIAPHNGFETAFGSSWRDCIKPTLRERLPQKRWPIYLPDAPQPRWERDVAFWTIPGTERQLLCDLWFPLDAVPPSGLAVIYLHGSAWCLLDKDAGTRPFFRHLCAQGHFVMDVAYRLMPETNIEGMVGDGKRAVAWLKAHATEYGIDPKRIVLAGGSAGGHLSLLAGYTPNHPILTPEDVRGVDLSVRAVISYYGPTDLRTFYDYNDWGNMIAGAGELVKKSSQNPFLQRLLPGGNEPDRMNFKKGTEAFMNLFPNTPAEVPEWFALVSPIEHVQSNSPATLLLYAGGDFGVPQADALAEKLRAAGVPVVSVLFPRAEHAFDVLPQWAPAAQASFYDVDHFLAVMA